MSPIEANPPPIYAPAPPDSIFGDHARVRKEHRSPSLTSRRAGGSGEGRVNVAGLRAQRNRVRTERNAWVSKMDSHREKSNRNFSSKADLSGSRAERSQLSFEGRGNLLTQATFEGEGLNHLADAVVSLDLINESLGGTPFYDVATTVSIEESQYGQEAVKQMAADEMGQLTNNLERKFFSAEKSGKVSSQQIKDISQLNFKQVEGTGFESLRTITDGLGEQKQLRIIDSVQGMIKALPETGDQKVVAEQAVKDFLEKYGTTAAVAAALTILTATAYLNRQRLGSLAKKAMLVSMLLVTACSGQTGAVTAIPNEATAVVTEVSPTQQLATETAAQAPTPEVLMEFEQQTGVDLASWDGQQGNLEIGEQVFATATAEANDYMVSFVVNGQAKEASLDQVKTNMEANSVAIIDAENHLLQYEFVDGNWQEVNLKVEWPGTYAETANAPKLEITEDQLKSGNNPISEGTLKRQLSYFTRLDPNNVSGIEPIFTFLGNPGADQLLIVLDNTQMLPLALFDSSVLGDGSKIIAVETVLGGKNNILFFEYLDLRDAYKPFQEIFDTLPQPGEEKDFVITMFINFKIPNQNYPATFRYEKLFKLQPKLTGELENLDSTKGEIDPNLSNEIIPLVDVNEHQS